jgi:hypothetical protein
VLGRKNQKRYGKMFIQGHFIINDCPITVSAVGDGDVIECAANLIT